MHLTTLSVRNFRNLAALDVELPEEGVVMVGPNGHGKTNLVEAIYYLVLFRSLRRAKDRELVRFGEASFFVAGATAAHRVGAGYEVGPIRKKVTVDGAEVARLSDAVGTICAVALSPADREIVAAGPAARRRYLDVLLSLSQPGYMARLASLRAALKQRNAALRRQHPKEAAAFNGPFAQAAAVVVATRRAWVSRWNNRYAELCHALGELGEPSLRYHQRHGDGECDAQELVLALDATLDRDMRRGMTTIGPHRDDLVLALDAHRTRTYGSAGQQRTAAIALRLLEAETLREATGSAPVALYDDVFAELDAERQDRLLTLIRETLSGQAIVTAPRESEVPRDLLQRPRWRILSGRIER